MKYWQAYDKEGSLLQPRQYSNGKTQDMVIQECHAILSHSPLCLMRGASGTGKTLIGLNLANQYRKTYIIVPRLNLQDQYVEDHYGDLGKKYILRPDGQKMRISVAKGRGNFECCYLADHYADDPLNPCIVQIRKDQARRDVAIECPYWSPITSKQNYIDGVVALDYDTIKGRKYMYARAKGCGYYDQFIEHMASDAIIINSKKFMCEFMMGRLLRSDLLVIDEFDLFLDELKAEMEINEPKFMRKLSKLSKDLSFDLYDEIISGFTALNHAMSKTMLNEVYQVKGTDYMMAILDALANAELREVKGLASLHSQAKTFKRYLNDSYFILKDVNGELVISVFLLNLKNIMSDILKSFPHILGMSATLQDRAVLSDIYGITPELYGNAVVQSERVLQGKLNLRTIDTAFNCRMEALKLNRSGYLANLVRCLDSCDGQTLVHVQSYSDFPSKHNGETGFPSLPYCEDMRVQSESDRDNRRIRLFKSKKLRVLFSTKDMRGTDLPLDLCDNIIFTKLPYPNMDDPFLRGLNKQNRTRFWKYYNDKMERELLQGLARGLRSAEDHVNILSPDTRVYENIRRLLE